MRAWLVLFFAAGLALAGCRHAAPVSRQLPTGDLLDPAGGRIGLGSMPVAAAFSPDSNRIVVVLSGYRDQGVQVVDVASRSVVQTLVQPAAFLGACFAPDGRTLFVSGGDRDVVYRYAWGAGRATLADSLALGPTPAPNEGRRFPAGLACSPDGRRLYVAENLADSLAVVDLGSGRVTARLATGRYPCAVAVQPDGRVFVSAWGDAWVASFSPGPGGLAPGPRIAVGRHPSTLLLDAGGSRLYAACAGSDRIAVVDTRADSVVAALDDAAPFGPREGSTPLGLALAPDRGRLYAAEADNDAVAVFALSAATSGAATGAARDSLLGRVPVEWYPCALLERGGWLWVVNGKGGGTGPNPRLSQPGRPRGREAGQYTLGQLAGSLSLVAAPADRDLPALSRRVAAANHWDRPPADAALPPFRHVVYVLRENRSFDQVLGDLPGADGDPSLTYFPRAVTPNAHALAERFGVYDRFFTDGEVSGDGHEWAMGAYAPDYVERIVPSVYSDRRHTSDNAEPLPDDVDDPSQGYLWDLAHRAHASVRDYGEFTQKTPDGRWVGTKPWLARNTDPDYPGFDLAVPDTLRAERWLAEFRREVAGDSLPALSIVWLPNDHTAGARAGMPTPRACAADNDLALGRMVEAIAHSPYWTSTVIFVLEDDAQDGPDHVDSHRSVLLVISPYGRPGVVHRFVNTTGVVGTIDRALGLGALSKFDRLGPPLATFAAAPDTAAYTAIVPGVSRSERNPDHTAAAVQSRRLDLSGADRADARLLNRILWRALKGPGRPYPARAAG